MDQNKPPKPPPPPSPPRAPPAPPERALVNLLVDPPTIPLSALSGLRLEKICLMESGPNCPTMVFTMASLLSPSCLANCFSAVSLTTFCSGSGRLSYISILGFSFQILVTISLWVELTLAERVLCCSSNFPRVYLRTLVICPLMPLYPEISSRDLPCCCSSIWRAPPKLSFCLTPSQILVSSLVLLSTRELVWPVTPLKVPSRSVLTLPNSSLTTSFPFSATISLTKVSPYCSYNFLKISPAQHQAPIRYVEINIIY